MAAIITEKFRQHNAEQFLESFSEAVANKYYLFIGKSSPFTSSTTGGDDNTPRHQTMMFHQNSINGIQCWEQN